MYVNIDVEYFRATGCRSVADTPELIIDTSAAGNRYLRAQQARGTERMDLPARGIVLRRA
jgi:hypothetical protein